MEAQPYPLSSRAKPRDLQFSPLATNAAALKMRCHPDRSEAEWRDLLFSPSASNLDGSATLPFVIPSEAEGSAVLSTGHQCRGPEDELSSRPERSGVEGPAVLSLSIQPRWKRDPTLCHPERSRGICGSLHRPPMPRP